MEDIQGWIGQGDDGQRAIFLEADHTPICCHIGCSWSTGESNEGLRAAYSVAMPPESASAETSVKPMRGKRVVRAGCGRKASTESRRYRYAAHSPQRGQAMSGRT